MKLIGIDTNTAPNGTCFSTVTLLLEGGHDVKMLDKQFPYLAKSFQNDSVETLLRNIENNLGLDVKNSKL